MVIFVGAVIGIFAILIYLGASVLESEHNKRHPPDDGDGISEVKDREQS